MFKQLTAFILLFALMAQTFNKALVVSSYYTNTAAYVKNCENKAKPQLQCHGKCQMMKKLKEAEKKEQKTNSKQSHDEVLSSKSFFASVHINQQTIAKQLPIHHAGSPIDRAADFFHPPSV